MTTHTLPISAPVADAPTTGAGPPAPVRCRDEALAGLTIILPCFNEAANVADAIRYATSAGVLAAREHEIVVVDDGSSDETARIAAALARVDPRVRLVVHARNRGYGEALRSGMRAARMPWVLITDADLQFDLREIEDFLPFADDADLMVGWRMLRKDPVGRRINAAAWNWLVRRTFRLPVRDVDCAFKLIRRDLLDGVELHATGAMISTELLVKCLRQGARLREFGVHHRPRVAGEQSGASPRVVARAFRELFVLRRALRRAPRTTGG